MSSNSKDVSAAASAKATPTAAASASAKPSAKSANKRARQDKNKVVSPRPPAHKEGSAQVSRRQAASNNNTRESASAREEAKTIETTTGSAGNKRVPRGSNSNADLLKQSIRSEKVIKSSLNAKPPQDLEQTQSQATPNQAKSQQSARAETATAQEGQDQANSVVNLPCVSEQEPLQKRVTEDDEIFTAAGTSSFAPPGNSSSNETGQESKLKSLDDVKTVTLAEKPRATPKSIKSKQPIAARESTLEESKKVVRIEHPSVRPLDKSAMRSPVKNLGSGGNVGVASSNLMHEEDEEMQDSYNMNIGLEQEREEDPKRKFLYARQLTHYFEDNPPLPLLPKSVVRQSESPRTGGQNFLKLTRFRGQDFGKSKFREKEQEVERVQFPKDISTLKHIFQPLPPQQQNNIHSLFLQHKAKKEGKRSGSAKKEKPGQLAAGEVEANKNELAPPSKPVDSQNPSSLQISSRGGGADKVSPTKVERASAQKTMLSPSNAAADGKSRDMAAAANSTGQGAAKDGVLAVNNLTQCGELVYQRMQIDFKAMNKQSKRDTVVEENLLDVKKLLKNAQLAQNQKNMEEDDPEKKALLKVMLEPFYTRRGPEDNTLIFESRFESGNLAAATKVADTEYHLLLQNDVNTGGHTQWYFFRTQNVKPIEVRFNILNLCKPDSLYNEGMKILVYSEKMAAMRDIGWHRGGTKISYYQNGIRKDDKKASSGVFRSYYTHTFTYNFEFENDTVYFAYCYPYTYTDLNDDLNKIMSDPVKAQFTTRKTLCTTLAGNPLDILTITSKQNPDNMARRKGVVLTARVHPGESVGSWMMKGALDFLTSTELPEAEILRQNFVFKVIPMLNPDGVINGNYRCSLAGCDLNRRWKAPSRVLHPTIYHTKQMIHNFVKEREMLMFTDFHGHSRRKNIFMYGCNIQNSPEDTRIFPFIYSNICPFFIYNYSRFGNQKSKESTARMALFNELRQHPAIYTVESSFCGNDVGKFAKYHFSTENLMQSGIDFCRSILIYAALQVPMPVLEGLFRNINGIYGHYQMVNEKLQPIERDPDVELMKLYKEKMDEMKQSGIAINTAQIKKALLKVLRQHSDVQTDGESTSSAGSDNAPSEDNLKPEEIAEIVPIMEDPEVARVMKKKPVEKLDLPKGPVTTSPLKKRSTTIGPGQKKQGQINVIPTRNLKKSDKKGNDLSGRRSRQGSAQDKNSEGGNSSRKNNTNNVEVENNVATDDQVVHKKKLKKNVESKDACTQTERSDYLLIKQRQKQKEIMMLAKKGLLPPGVNPQALMQSYIQSQNQGVPFMPIEAIQKQLAAQQSISNQQAAQVHMQQMAQNHQVQMMNGQKQLVPNQQNQMLRQQIMVGAANNAAAAAIYQQQINQAYYMQQLQQQQHNQAQGPVMQLKNGQQVQISPLGGPPTQSHAQILQQPVTGAGHQWQYSHPNRNIHSSYSPQKGRKDGQVPTAPSNVYSNSSSNNQSAMIGAAHGNALAQHDAQRMSGSRGGARGSAQTMINNSLQPQQALEMSRTLEQQKQLNYANGQVNNSRVQSKIAKDQQNAPNGQVQSQASGAQQQQSYVHGGVIATMGRKALGNSTHKTSSGLGQPPNSQKASYLNQAQLYNVAQGVVQQKGQTPNPNNPLMSIPLHPTQQAFSRHAHPQNPQSVQHILSSVNVQQLGAQQLQHQTYPQSQHQPQQDLLPDILMQSPNPNNAVKKKSHQNQMMYKGPLNRTQNPTQIERLQVQQPHHTGNPSVAGIPQMSVHQIKKMQGGGQPVTASVEGGFHHQHHASNGQLAVKSQQQAAIDQQWRKRAIQNGKSQENLHLEDTNQVSMAPEGILGQPGSASVNAKRQTLEQQQDFEAVKKRQSEGPNSNSYIRNTNATISHQSQPAYPSVPHRKSEKVQYIQHGEQLERRVKKRSSHTEQSVHQAGNQESGWQQSLSGNEANQKQQQKRNETSSQHKGGAQSRLKESAQGRSNMEQYSRGGLTQHSSVTNTYTTPSKPASRTGGAGGRGGKGHPAQSNQHLI